MARAAPIPDWGAIGSGGGVLGKRRPQLLVWAAMARPGADDWCAGQGRVGVVDVAAYTRPRWRLARLRVPAHWRTVEAKGRMRRGDYVRRAAGQ